MIEKHPRVGIAVVIKREEEVLLGKRKNAHGEGTWGFPGGHLEYGESWKECAQREMAEECGVIAENYRLAKVTNDVFTKLEKHYVTLFIEADYVSGTPQILEPHKCEEWKWFAWDKFPERIFLPIKNARKEGYNPFNK